MDNQHRKIGYAEMGQEQIDLINELKDAEAKLLALHKRVVDHLDANRATVGNSDGRERMVSSECYRWASIAKTDFETGFMALVRAVAQPVPRGAA